MIFRELTNLFFENYKTRVREITYSTKKYIFERALSDKALYKKKIDDITEYDLIELKQKLLLQYTNNTVRAIYYIVINVFELAIQQKYIIENKAAYLKNVSETKNIKKIRTISKADFYKILSIIDDKKYENKVFLKLLYHSGLRSSEARALKWQDIDFDNNLLIVDKSIYCKKYKEYIITDAKTKSSNRCIMLDNNILLDLLELKEKSSFNKDKDFIFNRNGGPHPQHYSKTILNYACKKANISGISTHALRHSHVSHLIRNNVNLKLIQRRVGHSNASITLDVYSHLFAEDEKEILSLFE